MASRPAPDAARERRIAVAYSGGRDSTALLHATASAAAGLGIEVVALHVHHGLSPNADRWQAHAAAQCQRWAAAGLPVDFAARRLEGGPPRGDSVEAWARRGRYAALAAMAVEQGAHVVLLGHHQRDQAETFVLQALRGAGPRGLAAMPRSVERDGLRWERPWLDKPTAAISAYIEQHGLAHIEDESNLDARFARNRLRTKVWPLLAAAFPEVDGNLASAAQWAQRTTALLDEIAGQDLAAVLRDGCLDIAAWQRLSTARRGHALHAWVRARSGSSPSAHSVFRWLDELPRAASGRWQVGSWGELRLHDGLVACVCTAASGTGLEPVEAVARERALAILQPRDHPLPGWAGTLRVQAAAGIDGMPLELLAAAEIRPRTGGERFRTRAQGQPRSLKKQYQAARLPAWAREGPLLYVQGRLVFVPGLGLDAEARALAGQPRVALSWHPESGR